MTSIDRSQTSAIRPEPVDVRTILLASDSSPDHEAARAPATWIAGRLGARVETASVAHGLDVVGHRSHRALHRIVNGDHTAAVVRVAPVPVLAVPVGLRR